MTSSNLSDCSTGRSAGLAPFRMLSTKTARRSPLGHQVDSIAHEQTGLGEAPLGGDGRKSTLRRQIRKRTVVNVGHRALRNEEKIGSPFGGILKGAHEVPGVLSFDV